VLVAAQGTIVQASEQAREVMATGQVGGSGQLVAGQLGTGAVVLDRGKGTVGLVNASTLRYGPTAQLGPSRTDLALVTGDRQPYVVDTAGGRLVALDPANLATVASAEVTPQQATPAVVAPDGQLWALDVGRGQVVGLRSSGQVNRAKVTTPQGGGQLTLVDGRPVLVDPGDRSVARIDAVTAEVERRWCLAGPVDGSIFVAGTNSGAPEPLVFTLAAEPGELFTTNLRTGSCVRLQLRAEEETNATGTFGQPVAAGDLLFVPMPAKGEVLVVDGATNHIERSIRIPADRGHRFELFNDDGTVWFNDLDGPTAGVLSRDGISFFLDKYQTGTDKVSVGKGTGTGAGVGTDANGERVDQDPTQGAVAKEGEDAQGNGTGDGRPGGEGGDATRGGQAPSLNPSAPLGGPEEGGQGDGDPTSSIPAIAPEPDVAELSVLPPGDPATLPKPAPTTTGSPAVSAIPGTSNGPTPSGPAPERPTEVKAPSNPPADTLVANFKWEPGGQVEPTTTVTFTDTSVGKPTGWVWTFTAPDATSTTASGGQVKRELNQTGVWTVTLTVSNASRVDTSLPATIVVRDPDDTAPPTPDFSWTPPTPVVGETVSFKDRSLGKDISEWAWDFGDGTTSNAQNPTKAWSTQGSNLVRLTVRNAFGSTKAEARILVAQKPEDIKVDFSFTVRTPAVPGTISAGDSVEFQDHSTGGPTSWEWDFGDGTTAAVGPTFVHIFRDAGRFDVTLRVRNAKSEARLTKTVRVERAPAAPEAKIAQPDGNTAIEVGRRLRFVSGTTGNVDRLRWDWGDGTTSEGASAEKAWTEAKAYRVTLTATNDVGSTTASITVTVTAAPPGPIIPAFRPEPGGSADTPAQVGEPVLFVNQSRGEGSFQWDFGDGGSSGDTQPHHTYTSPGRYSVVLTMTSGERVQRYARDVFVVKDEAELPVADFTFSPASPTTGAPVQFQDRSTNAVTWLWNFGDGTPRLNAQNPSKAFAQAGTYNVTLTVTNQAGDRASKSVAVTVTPGQIPPPNAAFAIRATDVVAGKQITFEDTTEAPRPLTTPVFSFPTGQVSPQAGQRSVQYIFANPGTYDVGMSVCWVEDPKNCGTTTTRIVVSEAVERPVASFVVSGEGVISDPPPARIVTGRPVTFTSTSTGAPDEYTWSITGLAAPNKQAVVTIPGFDRPGRVSVTLTVANAAGQSQPTTVEYEVVDATITPSFTATSPVPLGETTRFTDTSDGYVTAWEWDFGDGSATLKITNPAERSPEHTYASAGTYTVTLTVASPFSTPAPVEHQVTVNDLSKPDPVVEAVELLRGTPLGEQVLQVPLGAQVQFSDTSASTPTTSWVWSWGDGTADTAGQRATHTFVLPGPHEIRLIVTNAGGTAELRKLVIVS
jgi:PKD repeat protein